MSIWDEKARVEVVINAIEVENTIPMAESIEIHSGCGNVFADLGLPDSDELLIKAKLADQISDIISQRKMPQIEAASLLGVDQPKVSALVRGKLSGFSIERLCRCPDED